MALKLVSYVNYGGLFGFSYMQHQVLCVNLFGTHKLTKRNDLGWVWAKLNNILSLLVVALFLLHLV